MTSWTGKDRRFYVVECAVRDASGGGVELEIRDALTVGQSVLMEFSDSSCRWGNVRHCEFSGETYHVGIEFESGELSEGGTD